MFLTTTLQIFVFQLYALCSEKNNLFLPRLPYQRIQTKITDVITSRL